MTKRNQLQCRRPDVDPDIFFSNATRNTARAKELCAMCPAQRDCLLASFARPGELGTWGGMTQTERADLLETANPSDEPASEDPDTASSRRTNTDDREPVVTAGPAPGRAGRTTGHISTNRPDGRRSPTRPHLTGAAA